MIRPSLTPPHRSTHRYPVSQSGLLRSKRTAAKSSAAPPSNTSRREQATTTWSHVRSRPVVQQLRGQPISATHRRFEPRTGVRVQLLRQRRSDHLPHRDQRHPRQRRHHIHRGRIRHRRHPQLRNLVTQHRSTTGWAWLRPGPPLDHVQALSVRGVIRVHEQIEKMKNLILMLLGPSAWELVAIPDP